MKTFWKRLCTSVLALALLTAGIPAAAETVYQDSGGREFEKLSKKEIAALVEENPLDLPEQIYEVEPSLAAPYRPGTVKTEVLQAATDRLNLMRRLAGLPGVELDLALSQEAQYGAVLLATGGYTHYPEQPADMEDDFYQIGLAATRSSNIDMSRGILSSVDEIMCDSGPNNISTLGHRRWQLNPTLGKVGLGTVELPFLPFFDIPFMVEKVLDRSGPGCDYDFIAWPTSGYFPVAEDASQDSQAFFSTNNAWSVTVDAAKYGTPSPNSVTVRLTRESDGKTWNFSQGNTDSNGDYFNVENSGYGVNNCIIFRPGDVDGYQGLYTVEIFGLAQPLAYQVNFFDLADADKPDPSRYFSDVTTNDWFLEAAEYAYKHGIMTGVGGNRFHPNGIVDRSTAVQIFYNLEGRPDISDEDQGYPYSDVDAGEWYGNAVYWARITGVAEGDGDGTFRPTDSVTRQEFAQMLYNYASYKGYDLTASGDLSTFPDSRKIADWAQTAMSWANGNGLINGHDNGLIDPTGTATRAQAASILMKFRQRFVG